ncbi:MAG TPA: type II secretion system protein GspC [Oligoflexia bacterium]|nr:type II secretion system protein GspC [Oligoflexia bacterium]
MTPSDSSAPRKVAFNEFGDRMDPGTKLILKARTKARVLADRIAAIDWRETLERTRTMVSGRAYGTYFRMGAITLAAYFLADTVSLFTDSFVPDPPVVPPARMSAKSGARKSIEEYGSITSRNIFNSQGLIPDDGVLGQGPARKSNLPLHLVGTVVMKDELKSIAAIEDKTQSLVFPVRVEDGIDGRIRITKIEHLRVYFINESNGQLEYIEIVDDLGIPALRTSAAAPTKKTGDDEGITNRGETQFDIDRTVVDKALTNINEILTQARAIPNFENGIPNGYKLIQIVPGSIYEKLGLKNGDVITRINGEPITDPAKPIQMFSELRSMNRLELTVKRGGRTQSYGYDIR